MNLKVKQIIALAIMSGSLGMIILSTTAEALTFKKTANQTSVVSKGDTSTEIANRNGISVAAIPKNVTVTVPDSKPLVSTSTPEPIKPVATPAPVSVSRTAPMVTPAPTPTPTQPSTPSPSTPTVPDYMTKTNISSAERQAFINKVAPLAVQEWKDHKILPSLTIAQACLEAGYGYTWLAVNGQNYFAIKNGTSWTGATIIMPTYEYDSNGNKYIENAVFRKYDSPYASIQDHTNLIITKARYANIIGVTDCTKASELIYQDGYSTDPNYVSMIKGILDKYNLIQYDRQAGVIQ